MRYFIYTLLICFLSVSASKAYNIDQIRKQYIEAINNSDKADKLCKELTNIKNPDALITAYLGSVQAIRAKHAWNPVNKMGYLKQGFKTIDAAVKKDPQHLEVRFLRFSLQYYVPAFLGYSKNLENDKNKIIDILKSSQSAHLKIDKEILRNMVNFMIDSKKCNAAEISILQKVIA